LEVEEIRQRNSEIHSLKFANGTSDAKAREFDEEIRRVNEKHKL
jgi:hypothetical protein